MSKINWKVRIKNKLFWVAIIPAVLLIIEIVAGIFGFTLDLGKIGNQLIELVKAVFAALALLGIVNDPTTSGFEDSALALTYEEPKKEAE